MLLFVSLLAVSFFVFPARTAGASDGAICAALGEAPRFDVIGTQRLVTRPGALLIPAFFDSLQGTDMGEVCAQQAVLRSTAVQAVNNHGDLVATKASGTAITFQVPPANAVILNSVDGDVVTGGGAVKLTPGTQIGGVIDRSGTHPSLASCVQAMADIHGASSTFASWAATKSFGDVVIGSRSTLTIDATGGPLQVLSFSSLKIRGRERNCGAFDNFGGELEVMTDPGAEVVINASSFAQGNCTDIFSDQASIVLVNVPGPGSQVQLGAGSGLAFGGIPLLAPERDVVVVGSDPDSGTFVQRVWARRVLLQGYTEVFSPPNLSCF